MHFHLKFQILSMQSARAWYVHAGDVLTLVMSPFFFPGSFSLPVLPLLTRSPRPPSTAAAAIPLPSLFLWLVVGAALARACAAAAAAAAARRSSLPCNSRSLPHVQCARIDVEVDRGGATGSLSFYRLSTAEDASCAC